MATLYIDGRSYRHSAALLPFLDHVTMHGYRLHPVMIAETDQPDDQLDHYFALCFADADAAKLGLSRLADSRADSRLRAVMTTAIIGGSHCITTDDPTAIAEGRAFLVYFDHVHGELIAEKEPQR